ncbi:MAG: hypothetical protein ACLSB9_26430 [Hydrogeniiclostridium mannosilyticum]
MAVQSQVLQCLFLLGCDFAILVLTVEHMTFVDVRRSLIQMQGPIQNVNVLAKTLVELIHKFRSDLKKFFREAWLSSVPTDRYFLRAGFLTGKQILGGAVSFCVPDFGVALVLLFGEVGVMEFVVELSTSSKVSARLSTSLGCKAERIPL